ncbi:MAG: type I methionyl aminopeptidase [Spirochaetaceae bacterium]|jgi:methionyl aminopeptidase|nr:type I methionyl aminopeptidase [Spirochaetaceae bacterium]
MIRLKNAAQIMGIRRSCDLLSAMYDALLPMVKAGVTTRDIDEFCREFIKKHGGKPAWFREDFPGAACVSINDEVIHGVPGKRRVRDGDLVSIDVGIDLEGYISDSAVTVMVGNVSPGARRLVEVTRRCLEAGIGACKAGNRIGDISRAVYAVAQEAGCGVVREYCGHGVGLDVHEDPSIPNVPLRGANPRIQAGMVLAIEPMINQGTGDIYLAQDDWTVLTADGKLSCHEEHTVAVFADRTEVLTRHGP